MWNNSKSRIRYTWGKICDCHIIEVEPYTGTIGTAGGGTPLFPRGWGPVRGQGVPVIGSSSRPVWLS